MLEAMLAGGKLIAEQTLPEGWTQLVSLYPAVVYPKGVAVNKYLYFYGGNKGTSYSKALWRYDTLTGGWLQLADAPSGLSDGAMVAFNNKLYYFGGKTTATALSGAALIYNIAANTWAYGTTNLAASSFQAIEREGVIWLLGGYTSDTGAARRLTRYNPSTDKYTAAADYPVGSGFVGVSGMSLFDLGDGNLYTAFGSENKVGSASATTKVYKYTIATNSWSLLPAPAPTYMFDCTAVVINRKAYFYCGRGGSNGTIYSFDGATWETVLQVDPKPVERAAFAMTSSKGSIYLLGGNSPIAILNELWAFTLPAQ